MLHMLTSNLQLFMLKLWLTFISDSKHLARQFPTLLLLAFVTLEAVEHCRCLTIGHCEADGGKPTSAYRIFQSKSIDCQIDCQTDAFLLANFQSTMSGLKLRHLQLKPIPGPFKSTHTSNIEWLALWPQHSPPRLRSPARQLATKNGLCVPAEGQPRAA